MFRQLPSTELWSNSAVRAFWIGTVFGLVAVSTLVSAADDEAFFESRIRPVLVANCYECHSREAGIAKGGLVLDTPDGLLEGGDSGPAIVPGEPAESLLVNALRYDGPEMPPDGRLEESVIADFTRWIAAGAPDDSDSLRRPG